MADGLYIGLMSGTSMDGIDAVLVETEQEKITLIASHLHPWPDDLRASLQQTVKQQHCSLHDLGTLDARCGELFAEAALAVLKKTTLNADQINAIGSHGQTLHHGPRAATPYSLQIGDPNRIAEITSITTVSDFRRRDIAAGGQGAPLVPLFHQTLFADQNHDSVILNIGGIANMTVLHADSQLVTGFDTGPGNCLMDSWTAMHLQKNYDANGDWAASGKVIPALLQQLLADSFFTQAPPKSTGTEYFSTAWLMQHLKSTDHQKPADVQATLLACSTRSITDAIQTHSPDTKEVLVCGGGAHNHQLMAELQHALGAIPIYSTSKYQLDPDWIEAMAFAWLASQTMARRPGNLPSVTGARHSTVLGGIYYA